MTHGPVNHVRSDALKKIPDAELYELTHRLAVEVEELEERRGALLENILHGIEAAAPDEIETALQAADGIDTRLRALELGRAAISVEWDKRRPSGRWLAQGERGAGRDRYVEAVLFAYREFAGLGPDEVNVTWRTQRELEELEKWKENHERGLADAPMAGRTGVLG